MSEQHKSMEELIEMEIIGKRMKELFDTIVKKADAKIAELDEREQRWKQFEIQIEENSKKLTNTIILNVGGKRFITSKSTLLMHNDTYFTALLSSGQFMPEENGAYFIDRNPKYFSIILEYLRSGNFNISHLNAEQFNALQSELDYYQIHPKMVSSVILSMTQEKIIEDWTQKKFGNLLWRASEHGFRLEQFQHRCLNKGPTVVIIKSTNGWIFGGYANTSWQSYISYYGTGNCFIFTLTNPHNISPTKYAYNDNGFCLYGNSVPAFGGGHDLSICNQSDITKGSYTNFPYKFY